jgi:hypothetical protein
MSDRYSALTVVLEEDVSEEQMNILTTAIGQLRGVLSVQGIVSDSIAEMVEGERIRRELIAKLLDLARGLSSRA